MDEEDKTPQSSPEDVFPGVSLIRINNNDESTQFDSQTSSLGAEAIPLRAEFPDFSKHFMTKRFFESRESVVDWCTEKGKNNLFVLVKRSGRNKNNEGKGSFTLLRCSRGGTYASHKAKNFKSNTDPAKKRRTSSSKCDCPFSIRVKCLEYGKWSVEVLNGRHNHALAQNLTGHAFVSRLKEDERELVWRLTESGVRPKELLLLLKKNNSESLASMITLYNERAKLRVNQSEGRSALQQFMKLSTDYHYLVKYRCEENSNQVKDLFFAHPKCIDLAQCFPQILILDCTYKTNRYKHPLLQAVSTTSTGKSFTIACAFMSKETTEHYVWVLDCLRQLYKVDDLPSVIVTDREQALMSAIEIVYPDANHILCSWHINKNVRAHATLLLKKVICEGKHADDKNVDDKTDELNKIVDEFFDEWQMITWSDTEETFTDRCDRFANKWSKVSGGLVAYCRNTWLTPYKKHFVRCWTDKIRHYGTTSTSRAEGQHSRLKKFLANSIGGFTVCWEAAHKCFEHELIGITDSFEKDLRNVKHHHQTIIFDNLRNVVAHRAMEAMLVELHKVETWASANVCMCILRSTHGLPCQHELQDYCRSETPIPLDVVDRYWRQLSYNVYAEVENLNFEDLPELKTAKERWANASKPEREQMRIELRLLGAPKTTNMREPTEPIVGKGRQPNKSSQKDRSTKRKPSHFEVVDKMVVKDKAMARKRAKQIAVDKLSKDTSRYKDTLNHLDANIETLFKQKAAKLPVFRKRSTEKEEHLPMTNSEFLDWIPEKMKKYVIDINNVPSDGHCGFHVVGYFVFGSSKNVGREVRKVMYDHIVNNEEFYSNMWSEVEVRNLKVTIGCYDKRAEEPNWMYMPEMGHVIAEAFKIPVVLLSHTLSLTFLPVMNPPDEMCNDIVVMCHVNYNHYVLLKLRPYSPLPPVPQAAYYEKVQGSYFDLWFKKFEGQFQSFKDLMSKEKVDNAVVIVGEDNLQ